jgi:Domain of unknown function (DUF4277)
MPQPYRCQSLDHFVLVAGMFDKLGITAVINQATQQNLETRVITMGHAVKAIVLNGRGFVNPQIYLNTATKIMGETTCSSKDPICQPAHSHGEAQKGKSRAQSGSAGQEQAWLQRFPAGSVPHCSETGAGLEGSAPGRSEKSS